MYRILASLCVVALLVLAGCGSPGPGATDGPSPDGADGAVGPTETVPPADGTPTAEAMTEAMTETPTAEAMTETPAGETETPAGEETATESGEETTAAGE